MGNLSRPLDYCLASLKAEWWAFYREAYNTLAEFIYCVIVVPSKHCCYIFPSSL